MTVIITLLIISILNLGATKIVYDSFFARYDCSVTDYTDPLKSMVAKRQEKSFKSGKNTLCGYLYESEAADKKDALILLASGHNACSDSYLWQIKELLDYGWSVFTFDTTGCCRSEGKNAVGFSQELLDLKEALNYIENQDRFGYNSIVLLGHSRGGYAACCALSYGYDIDAVVSVSGVNSAMEGVIGSASNYVGGLSYLNYGGLWLYQSMIFGSKTVNLKASDVLSQTDVPVLIVHGADDEKVPADKFSVYSYKDSIDSDKVEYLLRSSPEACGHTDLLFDDDLTANDGLIEKINEFLEKALK